MAYHEGTYLGSMLTSAQNDYINNVGKDYFTIKEFMLLGDPSLMDRGIPVFNFEHPLEFLRKTFPFSSPVYLNTQQEKFEKGKVFIFKVYLYSGDKVNIGEAALGICFPLKAHSSYPMHPVPHLSFF
jgi:hypothetical protein